MKVRDHFDFKANEDVIHFAAIDAQELPFADASIDTLYGYAFVHHLPDIDRFLAETSRVLRAGGNAVFMDNGMAPLWQKAKLGPLRPLMRLAHWRSPISEEDARVTLTGGFDEEDFTRRIHAVGGEPFFERSGFVHYLVTRANDMLVRSSSRLNLGCREWRREKDTWRLVVPHARLLERLVWLDEHLSAMRVVRENQVRLIWGFTMPVTED
jgi:SAM-dependent methyltransferase